MQCALKQYTVMAFREKSPFYCLVKILIFIKINFLFFRTKENILKILCVSAFCRFNQMVLLLINNLRMFFIREIIKTLLWT